MKKIIVFVFLFTLYAASDAQSRTGTVEYQKTNREAIFNEVPFPEDVIVKAIDDTLGKLGYKGKDSKGFTVYKEVQLPELGSGVYDLYFAADKKSKKEKGVSNVTMMISKGPDNFITEKSDPGLMQNAKKYMDGIHHTIAAYDLRQRIMEQEEVVKDLEKKTTGLSEDADDLQKKKKKLEKDIEDNIKEQADQQKELEKQRQVLSVLKATGKQ
jgi:hypothetical protein